MKIDKARIDPRGGTIKMEYKVMTRLQQCPQVCRVLRDSCGTHEGRWYMIMELLGANLVQMRNSSPQNRFQGEIAKIIGAGHFSVAFGSWSIQGQFCGYVQGAGGGQRNCPSWNILCNALILM
jgi:hypothetical protein